MLIDVLAANIDNHFAIDSETGILTVNATLDTETISQFRLSVQAYQETTVEDPEFDTQTVIISVLDYNDNPPFFSESLYVAGWSRFHYTISYPVFKVVMSPMVDRMKIN